MTTVGASVHRLRSWGVAVALLLSTLVAGVPFTSMEWPGSQRLCADVAVTVAVNPDHAPTADLLHYRITAGHSHGPPVAIKWPALNGHTYYVIAGETPVLVHNCGGAANVTPERLGHIEYRHGPGARQRAIDDGEVDLPGEFDEDFLWDGDNPALGPRLVDGANSTPDLPNLNGDGHIHIVDFGRRVGVNGAGAETSSVQIVVRDGRVWTAFPI